MAKLVFDQAGSHVFETGVSECVLYVWDPTNNTYKTGVAWNGIVSITEKPTGAEASAIYADNIKYLNLVSVEEFEASIEAYTYPDEWMECDGSKAVSNITDAAYIGQQDRVKFALAYKTKVGNDNNQEAGYKIHVIYGCMASVSERGYQTVNDSPEAITFSWDIKTTPVAVTGFKPTASFVVDKTKFTAQNLAKFTSVENALYGTDGQGTSGTEPTLKTPDEIIALLNAA